MSLPLIDRRFVGDTWGEICYINLYPGRKKTKNSLVLCRRFFRGQLLILALAAEQENWDRRGVLHIKDTSSSVKMGPQRAVEGVGTSKSDVGSCKSMHAIRSSSLTDVLQLFPTSSCPRRLHHQLSCYSNFSILLFLFYFALLFQIDFLHSGRIAKFLPGHSECCTVPLDSLIR